MKRAKWLLGVLTQNTGWKMLSLAIAVVVWAMVANEPEISTFVSVRVAYKNLAQNLEISSDPVTTVKLELRGPSGQLRGLEDGGAGPEVILDMSRVQTGERTFPIGDGNVRLGRGVQLVRSIPSEVRFHFERSEQRTLKVTPRFLSRDGYEVVDFTVKPDSVAVAGPASRIDALNGVLTDQVNIPEQAGSFDYPVNTFVEDPFVRFPGVSRVTVSITVRKKT